MTQRDRRVPDPTGAGRGPFLARIRSALGLPADRRRHAPALWTEPDPEGIAGLLEAVAGRTREDRMALLDTLAAAAVPLALTVIPVPDAASAGETVRRIVLEREPEWGGDKSVAVWRHPLVDALDLPRRLTPEGIPVFATEPVEGADGSAERSRIRAEVAGAFIGVTSADFAVAETATVAMKTRPGRARSVSLVPSIHVAVIGLDRIVATFRELYTLLGHDPTEAAEGLTHCMTFISGPSKTADIEACMVHGAHGPREMVLIVVTGSGPPEGGTPNGGTPNGAG